MLKQWFHRVRQGHRLHEAAQAHLFMERAGELLLPTPILPQHFWNNAHVIDFEAPEFQGKYREEVRENGRRRLKGTCTQIFRQVKKAGAKMGIQAREPGASGKSFAAPTGEKPVHHTGIDFFVKPLTQVFAPLDGEVVTTTMQGGQFGGYGPTIVLKHSFQGKVFYTLYGHLSKASVQKVRVGQNILKGQALARVGRWTENGGWQPHVHWQVMTQENDSIDPKRLEGSITENDILAARGAERFPDPALLYKNAPWYHAVQAKNKFAKAIEDALKK